MKTIGLLGGMSWESTALYYRLLNEHVRDRLGGLHSARIAMVSVDFHEIESLMTTGNWEQIGNILAGDARKLEQAGAELLLLCTNTIHKVAGQIQDAVSIPFLHLADATANHIKKEGKKTVGLLGTRFTMEEDFYRGRLSGKHHLRVLVPSSAEMARVNEVIFAELCQGRVSRQAKEDYLRIISTLQDQGAEGIILGCTEIGLLIDQQDSAIPLYDTTAIHVQAAIDKVL